jgi:Family of unknown function (DUF6314)
VTAELIGRWTVERVVRDERSGTSGRFRGTATFAPDGRWLEEGTLELGAYRGPARRELRIAGDTVEFADGRAFHLLDLTGAPVRHLCGEDTYTGAYRLVAPDRLEVSWRVTGPDKDQHIETVYRRV